MYMGKRLVKLLVLLLGKIVREYPGTAYLPGYA